MTHLNDSPPPRFYPKKLFFFFQSPVWKLFIGKRYAHSKYLLLMLPLHFITALLEGGSFAFILMAFSAIDGKPIQASNFAPLYFTEWLNSMGSIALFCFLVSVAVLLQAVRAISTYFTLRGTSNLSLKVQISAQRQVYKQIFRFSFPFVSKYKIGDLNEFVKAPSTFIHPLLDAVNRALVALFMIVGILFMLFWISPQLSMVTFCIFSSFIWIQRSLITKITRLSEVLTSHLLELSHESVQFLQGLRPIHAFYKYDYVVQKIDGLLKKLSYSSKKAYLWHSTIPALNEIISVLLVGAILVFGSIILSSGNSTSLPSLLTYVALTYRLATRLQICVAALSSAGMYYGSALQLNRILEVHNKEFIPTGGLSCDQWNGHIEFRNVSLTYPSSERRSLNEISFKIAKGSMVAFVGPSGSGKSTILDLILGLRGPTEGDIFIDSLPLTQFSQQEWRGKIGSVHQDTYLFNETIEENIRFGDYSVPKERVIAAAQQAGVSEFIQHLPLGYDTVIGERGYKLSGGERQRIALARAIFVNPEILILDEATSSLDSASEDLIQRSLNLMQSGKTVIIVAHRLSTVVKADQIFVVNKGKIIESGCHDELLSQNGMYKNLWNLQSTTSQEVEFC